MEPSFCFIVDCIGIVNTIKLFVSKKQFCSLVKNNLVVHVNTK
jgi:hypothetical protein